MVLYTCNQKKSLPGLWHPCGRAARALDEAGYDYELKPVQGYRLVPWNRFRRSKDREEVKRLSGTNEVPILVLGDGTVISDSRRIVRWAREHPAQRS